MQLLAAIRRSLLNRRIVAFMNVGFATPHENTGFTDAAL